MGIYSVKLRESAPTLDSVQTPGDVGVDLDQVEKDIVGDNGFEAHSDEVEAAVDGTVGDPIEEAYSIMYESEYNFNQLMRAIGVAELRESSLGREMIFEAADAKGFFDNVKRILKDMFAAIVRTFKKFIVYIQSNIKSDKKFVEKFKDKIIEGGNSDWTAEGFKYAEATADTFKLCDAEGAITDTEEILNKIKSGQSADTDIAKLEENLESVKNSNDADKMRKDLGMDEKVDLNKSYIDGQKVIAILSNDNDAKALKKAYNEIKSSYDKAIKGIDKLKNAISKDYPEGSITAAMSVCTMMQKCVVACQNNSNMKHNIGIKYYNGKRNQARKLARLFISAASGNAEPKKSEKLAGTQESAGFFNIKMI